MQYTYELVETFPNIFYIKRTDDSGVEAWIPTDPANADYQAYLNKDTLPSNSSTPQAGA